MLDQIYGTEIGSQSGSVDPEAGCRLAGAVGAVLEATELSNVLVAGAAEDMDYLVAPFVDELARAHQVSGISVACFWSQLLAHHEILAVGSIVKQYVEPIRCGSVTAILVDSGLHHPARVVTHLLRLLSFREVDKIVIASVDLTEESQKRIFSQFPDDIRSKFVCCSVKRTGNVRTMEGALADGHASDLSRGVPRFVSDRRRSLYGAK